MKKTNVKNSNFLSKIATACKKLNYKSFNPL